MKYGLLATVGAALIGCTAVTEISTTPQELASLQTRTFTASPKDEESALAIVTYARSVNFGHS
jgi:hypothetical protein